MLLALKMDDNSIKSSFESILREGIKIASERYILIFANTLIALIAAIVASITLIGLIIVPAIMGGYAESLIRIKRNQSVEVGDFFTPGFKNNRWIKLLLAAVIYFVGVGIGLFLLLIPGIYLSIVWFFVFQLIVDTDASIESAFEKSRNLIHKKIGFWIVFFVLICLTVFNALLQLIPIIGILLSVFFIGPFYHMICTVLYVNAADSINSKSEAPVVAA
jgi:hypothetical protein